MNNKNSAESKKGGGLNLAAVTLAAVAAAAGTYFLYGTKDGNKKRRQVKGWALKAKGEVLERIENMKELNEEGYQKAVDAVIAKYRKIKKDYGPEVEALSKELHSHWKNIKKHLSVRPGGKKK